MLGRHDIPAPIMIVFLEELRGEAQALIQYALHNPTGSG